MLEPLLYPGPSPLTPAVEKWFQTKVGSPTLAQRLAWPVVAQGKNLLLSAATGSGKTLAAFLPLLDAILQNPTPGLIGLYVAPLKALCRDACKNVRSALFGLDPEGAVRVEQRTGDTSPYRRKRQWTNPPHVLMTTPESLAILLAHPAASELFQTLRWVVIDEIHALVGSKRGADLALSLARLDRGRPKPLQRIGLSATCSPLSVAGQYLAGSHGDCVLAQATDASPLELTLEPLDGDATRRGFVTRLAKRLLPIIWPSDKPASPVEQSTSATLIFTNTRGLAERLTWALRRADPDRADRIGVHHSALAPERRRDLERRLKLGQMDAVISSTSLELGIDIGSIDRVLLIHPPNGVMRLLQRVGRSGHRPGMTRRGLVFTASTRDLIQAVATAAAGKLGQLEPLEQPDPPLDVLIQHLLSMAIATPYSWDDAFDLAKQALPFRDLTREDFDSCRDYLLGQLPDGRRWLPARVIEEAGLVCIANQRTARIVRRNLGTILDDEPLSVRLLTGEKDADGKEQSSALGEVDDAFANRLQPGDRFLLEGRCVDFRRQEGRALLVSEVLGRPQTPSWLGAGVATSRDLAWRTFLFRAQAGEALRHGELDRFLTDDLGLGESAQALIEDCLGRQEAVSEIPDLGVLLIESIASELGCEYVLHTPLHRAGNEALARLLVHRLLAQENLAAMYQASDLGLWLQMESSTSLAPQRWRELLSSANHEADLNAALHDAPVVAERFGRVAFTGLMLLRNPEGPRRKVGGRDWGERRLYDQVRQAHPDFVLLQQARREVRAEIADARALAQYLASVSKLAIRMRSLQEPSPLGEHLTPFLREAAVVG